MKLIALFALFQIPYLLPIAVPISCLISSVLLMQRLSKDQELTSLRSAGFSFKDILFPLLIMAAFIAVFNFYTVSELATASHLQANLLKNELRSVNPLLLLNNKHLMRTKGIYYDALGESKMGQLASQVMIAMPDKKKSALNLILADSLIIKNQEFTAKNLSIITPFGENKGPGFNDLLIESIQSSTSGLSDFSKLVEKKVFEISDDSLGFTLLISRLQDYKNQLKSLEKNEMNKNIQLVLEKSKRSIYSEMGRRLSAGLSPFVFTLLGLCFAITLGRDKKAFQLIYPICFGAFYLVCFFAAKATSHQVLLSLTLYLAPLFIITFSSLYKLKLLSCGVD